MSETRMKEEAIDFIEQLFNGLGTGLITIESHSNETLERLMAKGVKILRECDQEKMKQDSDHTAWANKLDEELNDERFRQSEETVSKR